MVNALTLTAEPGSQSLHYQREFDAPAHQVFRAHVEPELVMRWNGPREYEMAIDHFDARSGGSWAYRHISADKQEEYEFYGSFHEVTPDKRIVQTFEFGGMPGHPALEVMDIEELDGGRCKITASSTFLTVQDRDGMIDSGMEFGMRESFEQLDEVVARDAS